MRARHVRKAAIAVAAVGGLLALLLHLRGTFGGDKVPPGTTAPSATAVPAGLRAAAAELREVEDYLEWPGTVASRKVANVAPKLLTRILEVRVEAGQAVNAGDVLALLDDRDLRTRSEQTRAALSAAQALEAQAEAEHRRVRTLFEKEAATPRDLEAAEARAKAAGAQAAQAREALAEVGVLLTETSVRAPFDGVVTAKLAEPGDMAVPGRPIIVLHDPARLRLEAQVPESCALKAFVGMEVRAHIDALAREVTVKIEEIAPTADPQTRTFLLKAALPEDKGLRPGQFGRFLQPCGRRKALLVPNGAVERAGQLEFVRMQGREIATRHVRTGKAYGRDIEIISGLAPGERVLVRE